MEDNHNKQHTYKIKGLYTLTSEHQINITDTVTDLFNPDMNCALYETRKDILQQHQNISTLTAKFKMKRSLYIYIYI